MGKKGDEVSRSVFGVGLFLKEKLGGVSGEGVCQVV